MKKWEDYSKQEQTNYLVYWFHQYGNMIYTFEELENFQKLAETRQDDIFNHIVTSLICMNTIKSGLLLTSMRENKVDELFEKSITKKIIEDEDLNDYEAIRDIVVKEIIQENTTEKNEDNEEKSSNKGK